MIMVPPSVVPTDVAGFNPVATAGDCWFDADAGEKAVRFIQSLRHTKGKWAREADSRIRLEPWQLAFIRTLFGWKKPDGTRRFRVAFLFIPRKNGKSFLAAAIALYTLFVDKEPEAECYCAAGSRDQAALVFRQAASMVRAENVLAGRCKIRDSMHRIIAGDSFLRAIPANEGNAHGFNAHTIIGDELHTWPNRDFFDTLHTSTGAREQPLEVYITTAGHDQTSICYDVYKRACAVRDGIVEDVEFLPAVFEASPDDDWTSPETWAKANPNYGVSIREDYIAAECKKAIEDPSYENTFRRLHLNQWTATDKRWIQLEAWDANPATDLAIAEDEACWGGLDLSSVRDFSAFAMVAKRDGVYRAEVVCWAPADRLDYLARSHNIPVAKWINEGWLRACPGGTISQDMILEHLKGVASNYRLQSVGYDPYNAHAVWKFMLDLYGDQFMVEYRQGLGTMSPATKALEQVIYDNQLDHGGNPMLRWMADNAAKTDPDKAGNYMVTKNANKQWRHIDGIVALIMALAEARLSAGESMYEESGALFL